MEAKELRIGNLVGRYGNDIPHLEITDEVFINIIKHNWYLKTLYLIPLTEEWLLKFGFKKVDDFYEIWQGNLCYSFEFGQGLCFGQGMEWSYDIEIKHVHQLQNLYFALTGEELKINK